MPAVYAVSSVATVARLDEYRRRRVLWQYGQALAAAAGLPPSALGPHLLPLPAAVIRAALLESLAQAADEDTRAVLGYGLDRLEELVSRGADTPREEDAIAT